MRVEFETARAAAATAGEVASSPEAFELPIALRDRRPRLTERLPIVFPAAAALLRLRRHLAWASSGIEWATRRSSTDLPVPVKRHKLPLLRTLGDSELLLQPDKVTNLRIAAERLDGLILEPGQELSIWRTVGKTSRRRGYVDGVQLDSPDSGQTQGEAKSGIGELANLLHWMVLHTPLVVTERSEHSADPFPDNDRVLPWGVSCAVHYNYVDLRFRNNGPATYQLRVSVGERHLSGEIRSDRPQTHSYKVFAKDERFVRYDDQWFRMNEIWRNVIDRRTGDYVRRELIKKNCGPVSYPPTESSLGSSEVVQ